MFCLMWLSTRTFFAALPIKWVTCSFHDNVCSRTRPRYVYLVACFMWNPSMDTIKVGTSDSRCLESKSTHSVFVLLRKRLLSFNQLFISPSSRVRTVSMCVRFCLSNKLLCHPRTLGFYMSWDSQAGHSLTKRITRAQWSSPGVPLMLSGHAQDSSFSTVTTWVRLWR